SALRTALSAQTRRKPRSQPVSVPTLSAYATAQGDPLLRAQEHPGRHTLRSHRHLTQMTAELRILIFFLQKTPNFDSNLYGVNRHDLAVRQGNLGGLCCHFELVASVG
ncbi:hypothetical protein, partial [Acidiphilium sp. PM]|uniref:hypothetical protein n=1 Tax=Acidiphilium sp. PM TaxID=1043206 RepID=UPI0019D7068C